MTTTIRLAYTMRGMKIFTVQHGHSIRFCTQHFGIISFCCYFGLIAFVFHFSSWFVQQNAQSLFPFCHMTKNKNKNCLRSQYMLKINAENSSIVAIYFRLALCIRVFLYTKRGMTGLTLCQVETMASALFAPFNFSRENLNRFATHNFVRKPFPSGA